MAEIPPCAGTYEAGHTTCDGDPKGATEADRMVCQWRNRCAALQIYCAERNVDPQGLLVSLPRDQLVKVTADYVVRHQIVDGKPGGKANKAAKAKSNKTPPEPREPAKPKPPILKGKHRSRKRSGIGPLTGDIAALYQCWLDAMKLSFPDRRFATGLRVLAKAGTLYPVDRLDSTNYIAWYSLAREGRDPPVAKLVFKPRLVRVDVMLPVTVSDLERLLGQRAFKKLRPETQEWGSFLCVCRNLDAERVQLCAEVIRRLVDVGRIDLDHGIPVTVGGFMKNRAATAT
jgi:hypothetical protein